MSNFSITAVIAILKRQIIFSIFFLGTTYFLSAQTTLAAGDMAVIAFNSDEPIDRMTIVTFKAIAAGTKIYISDRYWQASIPGFITSNTTDGALTWTTSAAITAGTVISFTMTAGSPATVSGLPGTVSTTGWSAGITVSGGDNWLIYQGTSDTAPTSWIFGWANNSQPSTPTYSWASAGATTTGTTSNLPTALTNNTNAIALSGSTTTTPTAQNPHYDNMYYSGTVTGTSAVLLASITTNSNWTGDEVTFQNITPGGGIFPTTFTISSPVPVGLTTFEGKNYTNQNLLMWTTASESNNMGFDIEASQDGIRFDKIGFVKGNGTTNDEKRYSFTDEKVASGLTYYRLRQVDFDDEFEYSKVISVLRKSDRLIAISVSPNPAKDVLNIVIETKNDNDLEINLLDILGKIVKQEKSTIQQGLNNKSLDLQDLPGGIYFLQIQQGTERVLRKVLKE